MSQPSPDALRQVLRTVKDPASGQDIVAAGLLEDLRVEHGLVHATLRTDRAHAAAMETVRRQAEALLARQPGVANAAVVLTAHRPAPPSERKPSRPALLTGVRSVVAVASGKGGVGKSTVAVNLAVALARSGRRVGLLDADIYGPSLPRMLGLSRKPEVHGDRIQPLEAWGLVAMSIGFLVDAEQAMIWRGPMVMGALEQMMGQVDWGALDVMVVDMPPGTGDAQLTMAQRVALAGAVIVSTPQDVALADARRGVRMFERTRVPVLGVIENMSWFRCPGCGERHAIFGHGGAREEAARLGVPFLGEIPIIPAIRAHADAGTPIVAAEPDGEAAAAYTAIAAQLLERLDRSAMASGPRIVIE